MTSMRPPPAIPPGLLAILRRQQGAITRDQALAAGLTTRNIRTLLGHGWARPIREILVSPNPADPFRTSLSAALLAYPEAVVAGVSAARLHKLAGLPRWTPAEQPHLLLPVGRTYNARSGIRVRTGLHEGEATSRTGFRVTTLDRTVRDMARDVELDDLICLVDSALGTGWQPQSPKPKLRAALALADGRSESTFETLIRLLLVRAGIPPQTLQFRVFNKNGREVARVDMAWPSLKLAVEADGREHHDLPKALYRDRVRSNDLAYEGWITLRFTWVDLLGDPETIVARVRRHLNLLAAAKNAA
jgi:very-short-patch-repair endonuclease